MQEDMHFWGTYAVTRAAGIPMSDAQVIAYAAQYVDDSNKQDSQQHKDGGLLYGIATAHHLVQSGINSYTNREEQRRVWVPFHFIPGGEGETLEEKLLCTKDSTIACEMINHHINAAKEKEFGVELIGIAAHVYMDTFSHYGFSGISSTYNNVDPDSINLLNIEKGSEIDGYLSKKYTKFIEGYGKEAIEGFFIKAMSSIAEAGSNGLGHGGVATYPDRPFLHWEVTFERKRSNGQTVSSRDNPKTYLEGCRRLHQHLSQFAKEHYGKPVIKDFESIENEISKIIQSQGKKEERIKRWKKGIKENNLYDLEPSEANNIGYHHEMWDKQKEAFDDSDSSDKGINSNVYRFHQAAAFHRYYVLKDLLPKHKIAVY